MSEATTRPRTVPYQARGVPPPPTQDGVATLTIQAGEEKQRGQVSTPWDPLPSGAFQIITVYQCVQCGRTYGSIGVAKQCSTVVCMGGQV